jgi:hypothetical protein
MHKRTIGKSGVEVSTVGLDRMGMSYAYGQIPDKKEMISLIYSVHWARHFTREF